MCGIAGLIDTANGASPALLDERLREMMRVIRHRGPDDWGIAEFLPDQSGDSEPHVIRERSRRGRVLLGHQRLSIIDISEAGRQPMTTRERDLWLTFNGEIYNYIELRNELAADFDFKTSSDSEVILAAYRKWGVGMLERFDGMFAFALWDAANETLLCARDPIGIKPFYYAYAGGLFSFGSETRAVLAGLGTRGSVDRMRVSEFLVLGMTDHDDGTCYAEVQQLPGGNALILDLKSGQPPKIVNYWTIDETAIAGDRNGTVPEEVYENVRSAIRWQLRSDVPVGSCLSGGLDSGAIAAAVSDVLGGDASSYSALTLINTGFEGDESKLAQTTANHTGLRWVPVEEPAERVTEDVKAMVAAFDQPFSSLSMFGQYCVMRKAHELGLKVMLDGQGGDEVFLGYERVAQRSVVQWACMGRIGTALAEWTKMQRNASIPMTRSAVANMAYARPRVVLARNRARMVPFAKSDVLDVARPRIAEEMYGFGGGGVFGLQKRELLRYCLPSLLRFEDRNSMAFAVEARVPLLAKNIVSYALALPLDWRVHDGWTKYALRRGVSGRLPDSVVWNRKKRGFEVPQRKWVEALRPWLGEMFAELPAAFPIDTRAVLAEIDRGEGGTHHLWRAISVALWIVMNDVRY